MKGLDMETQIDGKKNIVIGLFAMAGFMLYGFLLIYLRDFAPDAAIELTQDKYGVVEPQVPHHIESLEDVQFHVEFLK